MKARLKKLRNKLRWRGAGRSGTTGFWSIEQLVPRVMSTWPAESASMASELQLTTDHFALADSQAGVVYTTHAVSEEDTNGCSCRK